MPPRDMELIDRTTTANQTICRRREGHEQQKNETAPETQVAQGHGRTKNAEEHLVRAQLVFKIDALLKAQGVQTGGGRPVI